MINPGEVIRERRLANGLTQAQLALRSGSTQAAISRLERGEISPTFETFERLLAVMGEDAECVVQRSRADYDRTRLAVLRMQPPAERLELALSWNRLAGEVTRAGSRGAWREAVTRREIPLDARRMLEALAEYVVNYVVIGGVAVQAHGHTRTTQDLDLVPDPSPDNLERLASALRALGARRIGSREPGRPLQIPAHGALELDTDAGGLDVHVNPPGAAPYGELEARAMRLDVFGLELKVAGRDDLIAMKRASGRRIDRSDILALTEPAA